MKTGTASMVCLPALALGLAVTARPAHAQTYGTYITYTTPGTSASSQLVSGGPITVNATLHGNSNYLKDQQIYLRWYANGAKIQENVLNTNGYGQVTFFVPVPRLPSKTYVDMRLDFQGSKHLKPSYNNKTWKIK